MENNQGYKTEEYMRKWFKGKSHPEYCVDFQTIKSLYEVKSCRLFLECSNGNHKRAYVKKQHKKITTTQMGRFHVHLDNHQKLLDTSIKENKIPKYIFVIVIGKQKIWRVKSWEQINPMIGKLKEITTIRIKDIFNETWENE